MTSELIDLIDAAFDAQEDSQCDELATYADDLAGL